MIKIFEKNYDGESIIDIDRDIHEAFEEPYNKLIPTDDYGIHIGNFKVTIEWSEK